MSQDSCGGSGPREDQNSQASRAEAQQPPAEEGASWRVWRGSLSDDSRCREFPNDWEYFYFWACAQFPTENAASS